MRGFSCQIKSSFEGWVLDQQLAVSRCERLSLRDFLANNRYLATDGTGQPSGIFSTAFTGW